MSDLNVDEIRDAAGTGAPDFPNGLTAPVLGTAATSVIEVTDFTNADGITNIDGKFTWQRINNALHVSFSCLIVTGDGTSGSAFTFNLGSVTGLSITPQSGNWGEGYMRINAATVGDRFQITGRFNADGTTSTLQFTQEADNSVANRNGNQFGVASGRRDTIQISAIIPIIEWA